MSRDDVINQAVLGIISRLSQPLGNPMGAAAPLAGGGGILKGTAPAQVPLSGFFRLFLCRSKKEARRGRRNSRAISKCKRRIRRNAGVITDVAGREQDEGCFAPAGATFFRSAAKEGKDAPGAPFHKGSPGPLLTAKGLRPIGSPARVYGGRWTKGFTGGKARGAFRCPASFFIPLFCVPPQRFLASPGVAKRHRGSE